MPSKVVIRVFFPNGLFKTALIDSETSANGLIAIIGRKLSLEYSTQIDLDKCELYECKVENPNREIDLKPIWVKNPFGDEKRKLNPDDVPFDFVQEWISTSIAVRCRFVMKYEIPEETLQKESCDSAETSSGAPPHAGSSKTSRRPLTIFQEPPFVIDASSERDSVVLDDELDVKKESETKASLSEKYFNYINEHRAPGRIPVKSYDDIRNCVPILDVLENDNPGNENEMMMNWNVCFLFLRVKGFNVVDFNPAELIHSDEALAEFLSCFVDICPSIVPSESIPSESENERNSGVFKFVLNEGTLLVPYSSPDVPVSQLFDEIITYKKFDKSEWGLALVDESVVDPGLLSKSVSDLAMPVLKILKKTK